MSIVIGEVICIWRFLNTAADRINTGKDSMNKIEDIQQSYFAFLDKKNAKDAVGKIIADGIEKWKKCDAYEEVDGEFQPNDWSGELNKIEGKTIGDIAKTDMDVLQACTGGREPTYVSHYGWHFTKVDGEISYDINQYLNGILCEFIRQNEEALVAYYNDDIEQVVGRGYVRRKDFALPLGEVGFDYIKDFLGDEGLNSDWMCEKFSQYTSADLFIEVM